MKKFYSIKLMAILLISMMAVNVAAEDNTIYGIISYHNDGIRVLPDVTVLLYDASGELAETTTSDVNGYYEFTGLENGIYTVTADNAYDLDPGGVSVASALHITQHNNGQQTLTPMQELAADVNADGQINMLDFELVISDHLVHGNPFSVGDWIFEQATVEFSDMKAGSSASQGVGGSSTGDVGGAFDPPISQSPIHFFASEERVISKAGEEHFISIKVAEGTDLAGMHLVLNYPSSMLDIIEIRSSMDYFDYAISGDKIILSSSDPQALSRFYASGSELITLRVKTLNTFAAGQEIRFSLEPESHFVNGKTEFISPRITLPVIGQEKTQSELGHNYPNPFSLQTRITYKVAAASFVNISVYGMDGRLISTIVNEYQNQGSHVIEFRRGQLTPGAYILRMQTDGIDPVSDNRVMIITSD